jgi:septal ring factor EnvC (AmiA/AmiB activator)
MLGAVAFALLVSVPLAAQAPAAQAPAAPPAAQAPVALPAQPPLGPLGRQAPAPVPGAPAEDPQALAARAAARIKLLQQESQRLAAQSQTALGELRTLEVEQALRAQELAKATAEVEVIARRLTDTEARLEALQARRVAQTPALEARLVGLYKRGPLGYARLLAGGVRDWTRASRAVIGLARVDQIRIDEHRRALATETATRLELEEQRAAAAALRATAAAAETAVAKAVADRTRLIADYGRRRAMASQYIQELDSARVQLQSRVAAIGATPVIDLPLRPFRGALEWPVTGRVVSRYGRNTDRFGTAVLRNGIEIAAAAGSRVRAVHGGTVAYAAPFSGFGILVIVDHGGNDFSLYGNLSATGLRPGATVRRGDLVGTSGVTLTGESAVYFELRIDGRTVNPVEWLRSS